MEVLLEKSDKVTDALKAREELDHLNPLKEPSNLKK